MMLLLYLYDVYIIILKSSRCIFIKNGKLSWELHMSKEIIQPIRQDFLNGMSYTAIASKYSIDPRTAKRYVINNLPLDELDKRPFYSVLDPFKDQIDRWLLNGPIFARTIHDRLIECGCKCGYTIVNDYVRKKILEYEKSGIYKTYKSKPRDKKPRLEKILEEKQKMGGNFK